MFRSGLETLNLVLSETEELTMCNLRIQDKSHFCNIHDQGWSQLTLSEFLQCTMDKFIYLPWRYILKQMHADTLTRCRSIHILQFDRDSSKLLLEMKELTSNSY